MRRFCLALGVLLGAALGVTGAFAQLQTTRAVVGAGGQDALDNGTYRLVATFGQPITGGTITGETVLWQGFWTPQARRSSSAVESPVAGTTDDGQLQLRATENPFSSRTSLLLQLPEAQQASVVLYDASGREVRQLLQGDQVAGLTEIELSGDDLSSGHYIARVITANGQRSLALVLVR